MPCLPLYGPQAYSGVWQMMYIQQNLGKTKEVPLEAFPMQNDQTKSIIVLLKISQFFDPKSLFAKE